MDTNQEKSLVRMILQSEITWLVFTVGVVMTFVTTVILPIQNMQIQLTDIHKDISENKEFTERALEEHLDLRSRVDVLETKVHQLLK